ncbi:DUF3823 domain-containing protein [Dysgonomonas sp. BGC7]|uniref:DUF3823 domain-containing protein n=1 Tax=Dysgonomonas sp. BGC7 TaxID=1658008 RepID=UPI0006822BF3|nr:DUF3823 domain-containing protein [Dysgonomonas sp. BGC7]MBD8390473.1 DUF3823 domain-containing protein [Dysgonomonas sp. BGC7]
MKNLIYITIILSILFLRCSQDNYDAPDAGVKGAIIDMTTKGSGQEKTIPVQTVSGAKIALYEEGYVQPTYFSIKGDGTFEGAMIFSGNYKLVPQGPFFVTDQDTIRTSIPTSGDIKFYLEPFLRININDAYLSFSGNDITVKFIISKSSNPTTGRLSTYRVVWANTPLLDKNTQVVTVDGSRNFKEISVSADKEADNLDKELSVTVSGVDPGKPVYVRVAACVTGTTHYNYSEPFEVE